MPLHPFLSTADTGARTVWVSRHGRTVGNDGHILQGWAAYELSESGYADVVAAKSWWDGLTIDRVVASPLVRATQTANVLFGRVDDVDVGWVEQASPGLEGLTVYDAHQARPDLCRPDGWSRTDAPRDQAQEHIDVLTARAVGALRRAALSVPSGGHVAVVSHGAVLVALLRASGFEAATVSNLGVVECTVDPAAGWQALALHDPLTATT